MIVEVAYRAMLGLQVLVAYVLDVVTGPILTTARSVASHVTSAKRAPVAYVQWSVLLESSRTMRRQLVLPVMQATIAQTVEVACFAEPTVSTPLTSRHVLSALMERRPARIDQSAYDAQTALLARTESALYAQQANNRALMRRQEPQSVTAAYRVARQKLLSSLE